MNIYSASRLRVAHTIALLIALAFIFGSSAANTLAQVTPEVPAEDPVVTDLCINLPYVQTTIPEGYVSVGADVCETVPAESLAETPESQVEETSTPVRNTCLIPDSLGDESSFTLNNSGEKTVAEMLAEHGYASIDIDTDQVNYQVWNLDDEDADSVTFSMRVLGKRAGNNQIVGYYKAGDTVTFTPILTQGIDTNGEDAVSVTIPALFADSFGFALQSDSKTWFSEKALNGGDDHVAVFNPSANTYLLAFEDFEDLGDGDYNDIVVEIDGVSCNRDTDGGGGDGENNEETTEIFGFVWHDVDEDDNRDAEPVLEGWTVRAVNVEDEESLFFDVTDENGRYSFNLPAGTWRISQQTEAGWVLHSVADGDGTYTVTVPEVSGVTFGEYNFGNVFVERDGGGGNGDGGGNGGGTRVTDRAPQGEVLGTSTETPAGLVLGEATTTIPVGAPNTGAGGTTPLTVLLPTPSAVLSPTPRIKTSK